MYIIIKMNNKKVTLTLLEAMDLLDQLKSIQVVK